MNERIKELAIQAGAEHFIGDNAHLPIGHLDKEGIEKFAELIIMDVASKLEPVLASEILELYGVEE